MRTFLKTLISLLLAVQSASAQNAMFFGSNTAAGVAPSITATATGTDQTGTGLMLISTSSTINVPTGKTLVVECTAYGIGGTVTVSDTGSANTFTASPDGPVSTTDALMEGFYAKDTVAVATDTITCNWSGPSSYITVMASLVTGANIISPLDTHAKGTGTTTPMVSGAFTTTNAKELVIAAGVTNADTSTFTAGTNFTLNNDPSGAGGADEFWSTTSIQTGVTATLSFASGGTKWSYELMVFTP